MRRYRSNWLAEVQGLLWFLLAIVALAAVDAALGFGESVTVETRARGDLDVRSETPLPAGVALAPQVLRVTVPDPTSAQLLLHRVSELLPLAVPAASLVLLLLIVRTAAGGNAFTGANVLRLRLLALVVGAGGFFLPLLSQVLAASLLETTPAADLRLVTFEPSLPPLLFGCLVLALAEVFAHGVRLREELDTVV